MLLQSRFDIQMIASGKQVTFLSNHCGVEVPSPAKKQFPGFLLWRIVASLKQCTAKMTFYFITFWKQAIVLA